MVIESATFTQAIFSDAAKRMIQLHRVNEGWKYNMKFSEAPAIGELIYSQSNLVFQADADFVINLTSAVQVSYLNNKSPLNFRQSSPNNTNAVGFRSNDDGWRQPYMIIAGSMSQYFCVILLVKY